MKFFSPFTFVQYVFPLAYCPDWARTVCLSVRAETQLTVFEEVTKVRLQFFPHSLAQAGLDVKDYLEIAAFKEQILLAC